MKRTVSKATAAALVFSVAMSAASCSLLEQIQGAASQEDDAAVDEVLAVVDEYAKAIEYRDTEKLKIFSKDVTDEDLSFFDLSEEDEIPAQIREMIADSIVCHVDEDTISASSEDKSGSSAIAVEIIDYEDLLTDADFRYDPNGLIEALGNAETYEINLTLDLELTDDGVWLVTNFSDVREDVYGFYDMNIFATSLEDHITEVSWTGCGNNGEYENTDCLMCTMYLDSDVFHDIGDEIYHTLSYEGEEFYRGDGCTAWVYVTEGPAAPEDPYLFAAGEYTISFYGPGDSLIHTESVTVNVSIDTVTTLAPENIDGAVWYRTDDPNGYTPMGEGAVYTATDSIEFDLSFDTARYDYSAVYYSVTTGGDVVYTSPAGGFIGIYGEEQGAEFDFDGHIAQGDYTISFFGANGTLICSDTCTVTAG